MNLKSNFCFLAVLFFTFSSGFSTSFAGDEQSKDGIMVMNPWSRPAPPVAVNGAAYVSLHNMGGEQDRLVGARGDIADMIQIHDHIVENGLMKMQHLMNGVSIEKDEIVQFKPGGKHLMLMGLNTPLVAGESFQLILQFEKAGEKSVTVEIREMSGSGDHSSHSMQQGG